MGTILSYSDCRIRRSRVFTLVLILPMIFRAFRYFPVMSSVQDLWYLFCFLYLIFVYPQWLTRPLRDISRFEWYILSLICVVPVLSGVCAWREYGQPIIYGILASRSVLGYASVLLMIRALRQRYFTVDEVERSLLILAWGTLILYTFMNVALDPTSYSPRPGFVLNWEGGDEFVLLKYFILFGLLYYMCRGFREKRTKYYLFALILVIGSLSHYGWRAQTVVLLATILILFYRWSNWKRFSSVIIKLLLFIAVTLGLAWRLTPDAFTTVSGRFLDAVTVTFTGANVDDPSADARIGEALVALEGFVKHPLLGNGVLSYQWQGGPESVLGTYFFADDVGLLGVLYWMGIFGMLFYGWQIIYILRAVKRLPSHSSSPLLDATKAILISSVLLTLTSPALVEDANVTLFYIALLYAIGSYPIAEQQARKLIVPSVPASASSELMSM